MLNSLIRIYFPTVAIMKARLERYLNRLLMLKKIQRTQWKYPSKGALISSSHRADEVSHPSHRQRSCDFSEYKTKKNF